MSSGSSKLARVLTLAAATVATTFASLAAGVLVVNAQGQYPIVFHPLQDPGVRFGTLVGALIGFPLSLGLLWRTALRRSIPLVSAAILVTVLLVTAFAHALQGAFAGLGAGVAAMLWCNARATAVARSALDGPRVSAENARPSNP